MATVPVPAPSSIPAAERCAHRSAYGFAAACVAVMLAACLLAGFAPLGFSIATVFLFAGPHNWLEARYMLTRMPARWGPLSAYFTFGIAGVVLLSASIAAVRWLPASQSWDAAAWQAAYAVWNTALIGWIAALAMLRSRQNPRRNWGWVVPAAFLMVAANWLAPIGWALALVYIHPLVALWFLDREISRSRPEWRSAYRAVLLLVPVSLGALWWNLWNAPALPGDDVLTRQITQHAGGGIWPGISTHLLVSTHTFLEMLHYGVWIVAIPIVSWRLAPWNLANVPLARRSAAWQWVIGGAVALGAVVMLVLWGGFLADYPLTRDIYFTVAMLHVLAEVPFLLRLL